MNHELIDFIKFIWLDAHLSAFGKVNRSDVCSSMQITMVSATKFLADFRAKYPNRIAYDETKKCFVALGEPIFENYDRNMITHMLARLHALKVKQ